MSDKFLATPSVHLATRDDLLNFLNSTTREELIEIQKYDIRSEYAIETIHRLAIEAGGPWKIVYNAKIKQTLNLDLLGVELSYADAHREGDLLSLIIYNAQGFHRADILRGLGFVAGTSEMLQDAFDKKMLVETAGGTICTPKEVRGTLYAMAPRSRTKHYNIVNMPVRLITKKQAQAIEQARKDSLTPDKDGMIVFEIGSHGPIDLATLQAA